jgi:hypothetical protein
MKNFFRNLTCKLGFHWWIYINDEDRKCIRCKKKEFLFRGVEIWVEY